jgi:hypothetical protein
VCQSVLCDSLECCDEGMSSTFCAVAVLGNAVVLSESAAMLTPSLSLTRASVNEVCSELIGQVDCVIGARDGCCAGVDES